MTAAWGTQMWEDVAEATERAALVVGKELGSMQQRLIDDEQKPDGSPQQRPAKKKREKNDPTKVPLFDTGRLRDVSNWRVRRKGGGVSIRPPKDREAAVAINRSHGYVTVFDELPPEFGERLQEELDDQLDGITPEV
jgi:hypothetical protein